MTRYKPVAPSAPHYGRHCEAEPRSRLQASAPFSQFAADCCHDGDPQFYLCLFTPAVMWAWSICQRAFHELPASHSGIPLALTELLASSHFDVVRQLHRYGCDAAKKSLQYPRQPDSLNDLDAANSRSLGPPPSPTAPVSGRGETTTKWLTCRGGAARCLKRGVKLVWCRGHSGSCALGGAGNTQHIFSSTDALVSVALHSRAIVSPWLCSVFVVSTLCNELGGHGSVFLLHLENNYTKSWLMG